MQLLFAKSTIAQATSGMAWKLAHMCVDLILVSFSMEDVEGLAEVISKCKGSMTRISTHVKTEYPGIRLLGSRLLVQNHAKY